MALARHWWECSKAAQPPPRTVASAMAAPATARTDRHHHSWPHPAASDRRRRHSRPRPPAPAALPPPQLSPPPSPTPHRRPPAPHPSPTPLLLPCYCRAAKQATIPRAAAPARPAATVSPPALGGASVVSIVLRSLDAELCGCELYLCTSSFFFFPQKLVPSLYTLRPRSYLAGSSVFPSCAPPPLLRRGGTLPARLGRRRRD